ncbi:AlpA family transcriptional regulator [Aquitalea sp. FJL05]|uniref:helix-turn-helix transcriptional regulator n=1 Tax=Aquitalea sp. FJL05 TaxID=2153366 RepID=UPI000F59CDA4|nr:AlpA family transcriptional regulator [Aquitalea sp. FJL05]RQO65785.1 AlpA family transcriptional regulator [Aquitalea sp. FJL05]
MKILRLNAVMEMTGLPRSTIYLYMKQKVFPSQVKLGARSVGWLEEEICSWIEERKCERA